MILKQKYFISLYFYFFWVGSPVLRPNSLQSPWARGAERVEERRRGGGGTQWYLLVPPPLPPLQPLEPPTLVVWAAAYTQAPQPSIPTCVLGSDPPDPSVWPNSHPISAAVCDIVCANHLLTHPYTYICEIQRKDSVKQANNVDGAVLSQGLGFIHCDWSLYSTKSER